MKNLFSLLLLVCSIESLAQGLIFDNSAFNEREELALTRATLPSRSSLKAYTPSLLYPQSSSDCVAHSFGMARTVSMARTLNVTDQEEISLMLMSPWFMYYKLSLPSDITCNQGLNIESAAEFALNEGFVFLSDVEYPNYYPFSSATLCKTISRSFYPPSLYDDNSYSEKLAFDKIYALKSIDQIKQALNEGMPVVVGMMIPKSFEKCNSTLFSLSLEDRENLAYGHAMLVIGYDDYYSGGCVEILNSWGSDWGNKGTTYISYKDFLVMVGAAYACYDFPRLGEAMEQDELNFKQSSTEEILTNANRIFEQEDERENVFNNSELLKTFDERFSESR